MNQSQTIYLSLVKWPCEYCKLKFDDVRLVITHEKNFCKRIQIPNLLNLQLI